MDEIEKELIDPSVELASEKAHRLTRASLAAVPALGGSLVEAFNALIEPPMARRKTAWMVQVTDALNELFQKGVLTEEESVGGMMEKRTTPIGDQFVAFISQPAI
jgi:hypothetical protein